ncbi:hypothetical protein HDU76_012721, partial [Blyttiomyces sp. JEL0837]
MSTTPGTMMQPTVSTFSATHGQGSGATGSSMLTSQPQSQQHLLHPNLYNSGVSGNNNVPGLPSIVVGGSSSLPQNQSYVGAGGLFQQQQQQRHQQSTTPTSQLASAGSGASSSASSPNVNALGMGAFMQQQQHNYQQQQQQQQQQQHQQQQHLQHVHSLPRFEHQQSQPHPTTTSSSSEDWKSAVMFRSDSNSSINSGRGGVGVGVGTFPAHLQPVAVPPPGVTLQNVGTGAGFTSVGGSGNTASVVTPTAPTPAPLNGPGRPRKRKSVSGVAGTVGEGGGDTGSANALVSGRRKSVPGPALGVTLESLPQQQQQQQQQQPGGDGSMMVGADTGRVGWEQPSGGNDPVVDRPVKIPRRESISGLQPSDMMIMEGQGQGQGQPGVGVGRGSLPPKISTSTGSLLRGRPPSSGGSRTGSSSRSKSATGAATPAVTISTSIQSPVNANAIGNGPSSALLDSQTSAGPRDPNQVFAVPTSAGAGGRRGSRRASMLVSGGVVSEGSTDGADTPSPAVGLVASRRVSISGAGAGSGAQASGANSSSSSSAMAMAVDGETEQQQQQRRRGGKELLTEEEKRANHIMSEQKRRNLIRNGFQALTDIVPGLKATGASGPGSGNHMSHGSGGIGAGPGTNAGTSKSIILLKAVEFIQSLESRNRELMSTLSELEARMEVKRRKQQREAGLIVNEGGSGVGGGGASGANFPSGFMGGAMFGLNSGGSGAVVGGIGGSGSALPSTVGSASSSPSAMRVDGGLHQESDVGSSGGTHVVESKRGRGGKRGGRGGGRKAATGPGHAQSTSGDGGVHMPAMSTSASSSSSALPNSLFAPIARIPVQSGSLFASVTGNIEGGTAGGGGTGGENSGDTRGYTTGGN